MKHLTTYEARKYKKTIMPIADFLYDVFFENSGFSVITAESPEKKNNNRMHILIKFSFYSPLKVEYLDRMKNLSSFIKQYLKKEGDFTFTFSWGNEVNFHIILDIENIKMIKELDEYKEWETKNKEEYDLHILKKYVSNKYNL